MSVGAPHRGDEAVERLPPLRVLDRDWTEVVSEPDGRDDPARVAVSDVFLWGTGEGVTNVSVERLISPTTSDLMIEKSFSAVCTFIPIYRGGSVFMTHCWVGSHLSKVRNDAFEMKKKAKL